MTDHTLALTVSDFTHAPTAPHFALADCSCGWSAEASTQTVAKTTSPAEHLILAWRTHSVKAAFEARQLNTTDSGSRTAHDANGNEIDPGYCYTCHQRATWTGIYNHATLYPTHATNAGWRP